jgi:hypothetical protein
VFNVFPIIWINVIANSIPKWCLRGNTIRTAKATPGSERKTNEQKGKIAAMSAEAGGQCPFPFQPHMKA